MKSEDETYGRNIHMVYMKNKHRWFAEIYMPTFFINNWAGHELTSQC